MMKRQILNIGKALNKAEQQTINGGGRPCQDMCPAVLSTGDYCRTGACSFGQCNSHGYCVPI